MADGDLWLISASGDTIDLNGLVDNLNGVQATAGLTGFGLPSVEVQYQTGAGDGATYKGQRVPPRDIDIPIFIAALSSSDLQAQIDRLTSALTGECTLQLESASTLWELKIRRTGGGDMVSGTDTDGTSFAQFVITVRAEDALWRAVVPGTTTKTGTTIGASVWTLPASMVGSAPGGAVVTVTGPTLGFTLAPDIGKPGITYIAFIASGQSVTVDMEKGTVVDENGENAYGNLAPGVRFFKIDHADPKIYVEVDNTSASYTAAAARVLKNYIANPKFYGTTANPTLVANGWEKPLGSTAPGSLAGKAVFASAISSAYAPLLDSSEIARPNLIGNPSFESNLNGWTARTATLTRAGSPKPFNGHSLVKVVGTAPKQTAGLSTTFSVSVGTAYTLSAYVSPVANVSGMNLLFDWLNSSGAIISTGFWGFFGMKKNKWTRLSVNTSEAPAGAVSVRFVVEAMTVSKTAIPSFLIDATQGDIGSEMIPYYGSNYKPSAGPVDSPFLRTTYSGLNPGATYRLLATVENIAPDWGPLSSMGAGLFDGALQVVSDGETAETININKAVSVGQSALTINELFVAGPTGSGEVRIWCPYGVDPAAAGGTYWGTRAMEVTSCAILDGDGVSTYWDGDTVDTAGVDYAWSGTAHNSVSTRSSITATAETSVQVAATKRNWVVI